MFDSIVTVLKLSNSFSLVNRDLKISDLSRNENDSEHSYQLALTVWYLANKYNLPLNRGENGIMSTGVFLTQRG